MCDRLVVTKGGGVRGKEGGSDTGVTSQGGRWAEYVNVIGI